MIDRFLIEHAAALSILMIVAGAGCIYLIVRGSGRARPRGALQWSVTSIAFMVILLSGFTLVQALQPAPAGVRTGGLPLVEEAALNEQVESFSFRLVEDDAPGDLEDYRGSVVLLNFWATWCPPCLEEMPGLNRLQEAYRDEGLVVLTVSDEPREELIAFSEERLPLRTVSAYLSDPNSLPQPFRRMLEARPMTFLIDREGVLRDVMVGNHTYEMFERAVVPYL